MVRHMREHLVFPIVALVLGCQPLDTPPVAVGKGADPAPAERRWSPVLTDIHGREHRPFDQPGTAALAIVFMMHDCPIANSYIPELNRLAESFAAQGICLLLAQVDPQLTIEAAREHAAEYAVKPPVLLDRKHEWVRRAGATRTPEAAVFSPAGALLYRCRIDDRLVDLG
jgi:hypothetical protein